MALIDCKECGNRVSDKAKSCPKCGAPVEIEQTKEGVLGNAPLPPMYVAPVDVKQSKVGVVPPPYIPKSAIETPKCGAPIDIEQTKTKEASSSISKDNRESIPKKKSKVGLFCGFGIMIVAIIVVLFLLVPNLRFWEDTKSSSRSHSDDSNDVEYCEKDTVAKSRPVLQEQYKEAIQKERVRNLSGVYIGKVGKSDIEMTLIHSGQNFNGSYTYTKVGNVLNLSGYINGDEISLRETTPKGNNSAIWTLFLTSDGLQGSMYVYHTDKTHNVTLTRMD